MAPCSHVDALARLQPPQLAQAVSKEQCTQCFDDDANDAGIDVCLHCFNGACPRKHAAIHASRRKHPFALNIRRTLKPAPHRDEPPQKITKLAVVEENDQDKYSFATQIKCRLCDPGRGAPVVADHPQIKSLVDGILNSMSSARQSEVKAWEEELEACEHTLTLQQTPLPSIDLVGCSQCTLKENLWLCLVCGSIGCGRQQFGGVGGNGHGLQHYEQTGHAVSVKLGTITPEGNADIYCYLCNDSRLDFDLANHLSTFGINVLSQKKTEKSMTELQIEHNLKYDFSLSTHDGKAMEPVFGPGLTGFSNLGNSCYMASVLQTLFALPAFQSRYSSEDHALTCSISLPADCIECQMLKISDGLLSGRYSYPSSRQQQQQQEGDSMVTFQDGLKPIGFKSLIGRGHSEFSTMKQQDSEEFLGHLITVLRRDLHKNQQSSTDTDPTRVFSYGMEQRLQCISCSAVQYRTDEMDMLSIPVPAHKTGEQDGKTIYGEVDFESCVDSALGIEKVDGWKCTACGSSQGATKQVKFATLPSVLVIHAKKFQLVNWVPTKLDVPLILQPSLTLEFTSAHLGTGLQPNEKELPDDAPAAAVAPQFDPAAMAQLEAMGFPAIRCQRALLATGSSNAEIAMEWLFSHMEDPDIDDPLPTNAGGKQDVQISDEQVSMLADMGFTHAQAKKALKETSGSAERAVEWLFNHPEDTGEESLAADQTNSASRAMPGSKEVPARYRLKAFISHKGPSVHSGHYVAHVRALGDEWVLFNDEKVVKADKDSVDDLVRLAYLYIFEKV